MTAEFDSISDHYSKEIHDALGGWNWAGHRAFFLAKRNIILAMLAKTGGVALDFGCGLGQMQSLLGGSFRLVIGIDPSREMLANNPLAKRTCLQFDGERLPLRSDSVDFCYAICVLHHIGPALRSAALREIHRVLRQGGQFLLIEHNLKNPLVRRLLRSCDMDEHAEFLTPGEAEPLLEHAGFRSLQTRFLVFSPAPAWPIFRWMENLFAQVPIGGQFAIIGTKPTGVESPAP